jgi:hypothetical protein
MEPTYDVFISFKNLDEDGMPTRDSFLAEEVYKYLVSKGLTVFFSNVTLEKLGIAAYKKTIDDALDGARVLVAVGTSGENLGSQWVRYEWDSFFNDILSCVKPAGRVFVYVENTESSALPRALRQTQTIVHAPGFSSLERLCNFIANALAIDQEQNTSSRQQSASIDEVPYNTFHSAFREIVAARRVVPTGGLLHVVFGNLADIRQMPVVIPVGQTFDFWQRGPRSVLASFENLHVRGRPFFNEIEEAWPVKERPKSAGLGHIKFLKLPENSQDLPGVIFVVTTRNLYRDPQHRGQYTNTPIEGIDYVLDRVLEEADARDLRSIAMPLLGTGYANVRRTIDNAKLDRLLRRAVTLLTLEKIENKLRDNASPLRRGVVVVYSQEPYGAEEHALWEAVTRFLGSQSERRATQRDEVLQAINELCA